MAKTARPIYFGIHSITLVHKTTGEIEGDFQILGSGAMAATTENVKLFGGSKRTTFAVETTVQNTEFTFTSREFPQALFEKFLGETTTTTAASATGSISDILANKTGVSVFDATTGIASVTLKSGSTADLKSTFYIVKAVSATTVDVYAVSSSGGFSDADMVNDAQKITAAPLTITASTAVEIPDTGLELTGGSGVIALVTADTAVCSSVAAHSGYDEISIGTSAQTFNEFKMIVMGQRSAEGKLMQMEIFNARASSGMSIPFGEKEFAETELVVDALYDATEDAAFRVRTIDEV